MTEAGSEKELNPFVVIPAPPDYVEKVDGDNHLSEYETDMRFTRQV